MGSARGPKWTLMGSTAQIPRDVRLGAVGSLFQHVAYSDPTSLGIAQRVLSIPRKRTTRRMIDYLTREELEDLLGTAAVLRELRQLRADSRPESPGFVNARGHRLTRFGVTHILRRAIERAANRRRSLAERAISSHAVRHTAAMHLLQSGVDLTTIRSWLGHVSVDTTHHYLEADVEMKREALAKCDAPEAVPLRYQPSDELLALLDRL